MLLFFSNTTLKFFRHYFKMITICDEYMRYCTNRMYLSNQVNGNTCVDAKKAPDTRIKVKGCTTPLMTYFTEKSHDIWDRDETRGRVLLAEIVGCYIPCSINLYGCIGHIYRETIFQLRLCLSGWEIKILLFSWNPVSKMTMVSNSAS